MPKTHSEWINISPVFNPGSWSGAHVRSDPTATLGPDNDNELNLKLWDSIFFFVCVCGGGSRKNTQQIFGWAKIKLTKEYV